MPVVVVAGDSTYDGECPWCGEWIGSDVAERMAGDDSTAVPKEVAGTCPLCHKQFTVTTDVIYIITATEE